MIQLYPKGQTDFSRNGIELAPQESEVNWQIAARYDFSMSIPREACEGITFDYGQILRVSVPPEHVDAISLGTVSYYETNKSTILYSQIPTIRRVSYKAWNYTVMGAQVNYAVGDKVTYDRKNYRCTSWDSSSPWVMAPPSESHPFWTQIPSTTGKAGKEIATLESGTVVMKVRNFNSEYMEAATLTGYQGYIKISDCDATGTSEERTIPAFDITTQLFTINKIDKESDKHLIRIEAEHISYQLGRTMLGECNVVGVNPATALRFIQGAMMENYTGGLYSGIDEGAITADWSWKNAQAAILDPSTGLLKDLEARAIRNNRDIYIVPNPENNAAKYEVLYGVNMKSVKWTGDVSGIVTRVYPLAQQEDGSRLTLPEEYIDSVLNVPYIRPESLDTKLKVGQEIENSDGTKVTLTESDVLTRMRQAAQNRFSVDRCDRAEVTLEIDFVHMPDTVEYQQYAAMRRMAPGDWVKVNAGPMNVDSVIQLTEYVFDPIRLIYKHTGYGKKKQRPTVAGYNMKTGAVTNRALAAGAVSGQNIQAGAITAREIEAGSITADQIASRIITAELIAAGAIRADAIDTTDLTAIQATLQIASIASAQIQLADIGYAQIKDANVQSLIAKDALTDRYYIDKLQVRNVQAVNATVGELIVKAKDNKYYRLDISTNGVLTPTEVTNLTSAEIAAGVTSDGYSSIIETDLTVQDLAANNVKAINALIDKLNASRINVDELFARTAFINKLNTTNIETTANLVIKTGGTFTVQSGKFEIDSSGNVTMTGKINAEAGGKIAGWDVNADSLTGNKTGIAKTTTDSDIAFWAGNATAGSANFRVTQGGDVYLRSLKTLNEQGQSTTVDLGNYPFWKLGYATVKSWDVTGNTLTIETTAGTITFSKAATTAHLVGSWSGNTYEVYADNDPDVLHVSTTISFSPTSNTINSFNNHIAYATVSAPGVTGPLKMWTIDASGEYSAGQTAGANSVTVSAGGWQNGANRVTASNGEYVDVTLPSFSTSGGTSFSNHKTTVYFYTASVTGALASKQVDATSEYNAGVDSVTVSAGGWQNGANRVTASNGEYVNVTLPSFSTSGGTSFSSHKTTVYFSTASVTGALASKEVDATSEYNAGWAAAAAKFRRSGNTVYGPSATAGGSDRSYTAHYTASSYTASSYTASSYSSSWYRASTHSYTASTYTASSATKIASNMWQDYVPSSYTQETHSYLASAYIASSYTKESYTASSYTASSLSWS